MSNALKAIKALRNTRASGKAVAEGKTYKVPQDISLKDAERLIAMSKAAEATVKKSVKKSERPWPLKSETPKEDDPENSTDEQGESNSDIDDAVQESVD